ncbi:MAG: ATP-binding cassette domain-containing protein, partial [Oscillospiraceae bacterium]|nr:ATP-binding cassette domain-containing protein [Oscillospiraceae bacterium]
DATDEMLQKALDMACATEFVSQLPMGLQTPVKERGGGMSEGQLQRLCIARALLSEAPILLMDEATSALDIKTERKVLRNIMQERAGRMCILTTHRPSALNISDRIYYISNDTISPITVEDLRTKTRLADEP